MRRRKVTKNINLIQFDAMPPERHRELSARGGVASGEARRKKAAVQAAIQEAFERYATAEGLLEDVKEFKRWKKRRK